MNFFFGLFETANAFVGGRAKHGHDEEEKMKR